MTLRKGQRDVLVEQHNAASNGFSVLTREEEVCICIATGTFQRSGAGEVSHL